LPCASPLRHQAEHGLIEGVVGPAQRLRRDLGGLGGGSVTWAIDFFRRAMSKRTRPSFSTVANRPSITFSGGCGVLTDQFLAGSMRLSSKARTGPLSPEWTSHVSRRRADRASEKVADVLDGLRLASVSWAVITSQPSVMAHGNGPRRRARLGWRGLQTDMESRHRPPDLWDWVGPLYQLPPCLPDSAWSGHIPFLALLIRMAKPRTFVELGVWLGASFLRPASAKTSTRGRAASASPPGEATRMRLFDGDPISP
jgi:hypothetical protein